MKNCEGFMEVIQNPITPETCFVPKTHEGRGRRTAVAPGATAARYLHYGRITLAAGDAPVSSAAMITKSD